MTVVQQNNFIEFNKQLEISQPQIQKALPKNMNVERLLRVARTEYQLNEMIQRCEPRSIVGAVIQAAQLGLEVGSQLGLAYLVPYKGKCQLILGYRGMMHILFKSGVVKSLNAHCVYENDFFEFEYGLEEKLRHKPAFGNRGEFIAVYAIAHLTDGGHQIEVMYRDEVYKCKSESSSSNSKFSPWAKFFDEMAKKTVVRRLFKYLPVMLSNDDELRAQQAVSVDDAGEAGAQNNEKIVEAEPEPNLASGEENADNREEVLLQHLENKNALIKDKLNEQSNA